MRLFFTLDYLVNLHTIIKFTIQRNQRMWTKTHSKIYQGINKKDIWRIWTDVNNWPAWHSDLDYCKMDGSFIVGNHFMLKPKGVPAVKITLVEIDEERAFTDCTKFFGAKMYDTHTTEETPNGLRLTNTLVVTGPLKYLWIKLVAQNIADTVPEEMDSLVKLAREKHG